MTLPWPIQVTPLAPVACGATLWRQGDAFGVTVIVKATFGLVHEGSARLVAPADIVREDRYRGKTSSLEEASEVAPYLPSVGVIFHGSAHAPPGQPAPAISARLGIFGEGPLLDKTLHVFGHRGLDAPGSPRPFDAIPIVYERAFGGPRVEDNPVGTGAAPGSPLPNIVDPQKQQRPAGFGPISKHWGTRRRLLGAVDAAALDRPVAEIPSGFGWGWFHGAPIDQQIAFLRGDEWIVLDGLHPSTPHLRTRLPSVQAYARFCLVGPSGPGPERAIGLRADTLLITPEAGVCAVIWRGHVMIDQAESARMRVVAGVEMARSSPAASEEEARDETARDETAEPLNQTERIVLSKLARPALPFSGDAPTPGPAAMPRAATLPGLPQKSGERSPPSSSFVASLGQTRTAIVPLNAGELPFKAPPAPLADDPSQTGMIDIRELEAKALAPFSISAPRARAEASPAIPGAPWSSVPVAPAPSDCDDGTLPMTSSPLRALSEPTPAPAEHTPPPSIPRPASVGGGAGGGATSDVRERMATKLAAGLSLEGEDLSGADLSGFDFSALSLAGCSFGGANLSNAVFKGARAAGVSFHGANLCGADLREGSFVGASFVDAALRKVVADKGVFDGASFVRADLTAASFRRARLVSANLAHANLDATDFRHANLERANVHGTVRATAKLLGANMKGLVESAPASRDDGPR